MESAVQDAVLAELAKILASPQFARAERLSTFLRFVVNEAAEGRADALKETIIGVEVFGKPAGYDPKTDSTVRIQASRLREKLRDYYLTAGAEDELIIQLPKGSYVPVWERAQRSKGRFPRLALAGLVAGLLVAGSGLAWFWRTPRPLKSIAVLPLRNLGGEADNELIAEGLAEDLIRELAGLPEVRVVSQTSSFALKGKGKSMREIGALLDVEGVVEGSLHRVGDRVKVSAQLVRTADDRAVWSGAFEREFKDLFALEDELSSAIAQSLHANLERQQRSEATNPEAYAIYLRGLYAMRRSTPSAAREAVNLFQEAVGKDPLLARAWSAQAFGWFELGVLADMPAREVAPRARTAALRALELDARLPEAHVALALVRFLFEANRQSAEEAFRRALDLGPNSAEAWGQYASYLMDTGRMQEGLAAARRGEQLDPLSPATGRLVASVLYNSRRYDEAIAQARAVLQRDPEVRSAYRELGRAYLARGLCAEALDAFRRLQDEGFQGEVLARCGRREEALEIVTRLKREADADHTRRATGVARVYMALGDHARALEYLERTHKEYGYVQRLRDPAWDPLRGEPKFIALRKQMGLD
jgi:TolB-like protein/cytochrome c-type biogenesis protein CcmH/NrfG